MILRTIQKDASKELMIRNIYRRRDTGQERNEDISMTDKSVALQKKMLGSFRTEGASTGSRGAVGKVVVFTMIA